LHHEQPPPQRTRPSLIATMAARPLRNALGKSALPRLSPGDSSSRATTPRMLGSPRRKLDSLT
jgi:hypothetical protein